MLQRALVIFENEKISPKAVTYARELALRMDSEITLLMLVEMPFSDRAFIRSKRHAIKDLEERMGKVLSECSAEFLKQGIVVSAALRIGAPHQEFLKFLAERPPFHIIIWGSSDDRPGEGQSLKNHWIGRVAGNLECPLVTVSGKGGGKLTRPGEGVHKSA